MADFLNWGWARGRGGGGGGGGTLCHTKSIFQIFLLTFKSMNQLKKFDGLLLAYCQDGSGSGRNRLNTTKSAIRKIIFVQK